MDSEKLQIAVTFFAGGWLVGLITREILDRAQLVWEKRRK